MKIQSSNWPPSGLKLAPQVMEKHNRVLAYYHHPTARKRHGFDNS